MRRVWFLASALRFASASNLRHQYYVLRHGQSLANVQGIISSEPSIACVQHGLSDVGWEQAHSAASDVCKEAVDCGFDGVAIISSDFRRAWQTAQAVRAGVLAHGLACWPQEDVCAEVLLRERSFGSLSGGSDARYNDVWVHDALSAEHTEYDTEPIFSVLERAWSVVEHLESGAILPPGRWMVVLVAHGDVLQILQTGFARVDPRTHRSLPHLETASLRRLTLATDRMPWHSGSET